MKYENWSLEKKCEMASKVMWPIFRVSSTVVGREKGEAEQAKYMKNLLRTHHKKFFLSGLKPLGIRVDKLPPAVACARYHYLSNAVGGISMEYVEESPKKVWIRYIPGTPAEWLRIGVSPQADRAMMEGWHALNGESLYSIGVKNALKVGVVITKLTSAGDPFMEMYFQEYKQELKPYERCKIIPDPNPPNSTHYGNKYIEMLQKDSGSDEYPRERIQKGRRAFCNYYAETVQETLIDLYGTTPACGILDYCWRLIAVMNSMAWKKELGIKENNAKGMVFFMKALADIQDESTEIEEITSEKYVIRKLNSRMFRDRLEKVPPQIFVAQNGFYEVAAQCMRNPVRGPKIRIKFQKSMAEGDSYFEWIIMDV